MLIYANAKINLALEVFELSNGFHNVNNIMIPINLKDEIDISKSNKIEIEELKDFEKIQIIKNICKYKHKELSDVVITAIVNKSASGVPLYLSLVVERLLMLDNEDFQNIRHLGDGMEAINNYMISIVNDLGEDITSITQEIFKELAERINFDLVMRLLYLSSHNCSLDIDQYHNFFSFTNLFHNK